MKSGNEKLKELEELERIAEPLVKYLRNNHHPHTKIVITCESAVVVEITHSIPID